MNSPFARYLPYKKEIINQNSTKNSVFLDNYNSFFVKSLSLYERHMSCSYDRLILCGLFLCKEVASLRQVLFKGKHMERIRLKLKAYDHRVLDRTVAAIVEAVKRTGADVRGPVPMPTKIKRYTVLKSPHINKDSREQFEMRIHARMLDIVAATPETVDSLTKLDLAPEVNVEVRAMK